MTRSAQAIGAIAKKRGQAASLGAPFEPDWQISSALPVALMCQLPKFLLFTRNAGFHAIPEPPNVCARHIRRDELCP